MRKSVISVFTVILINFFVLCAFTGWIHAENKPFYETSKGQDSIEWVYLWDEPRTREEKLERILTSELQRRMLLALQEKKYVKSGKENIYYFDPFKVVDIRKDKHGVSEIDVLASVYRVINNKTEKKAEKFQITFRYNYDFGFMVIECQRVGLK
ncbi:hypothetical protein DFP93_101432 [Aneurinibacillus soli]|uniref:Uncharacterized protein n=1 Tax=Aneurinibacillus soli TaxID=1500254 RepID=A0A0U5B230_9BACL|nr:hypothetical protein [Aneurinibacillus soli]PYE64403.1 hypothetical protein DFP93_101432 [Aneurinibacillus soli]BAU28352.1 hypothetical protein CB4_02526 [Aneurinibacillus soli]